MSGLVPKRISATSLRSLEEMINSAVFYGENDHGIIVNFPTIRAILLVLALHLNLLERDTYATIHGIGKDVNEFSRISVQKIKVRAKKQGSSSKTVFDADTKRKKDESGVVHGTEEHDVNKTDVKEGEKKTKRLDAKSREKRETYEQSSDKKKTKSSSYDDGLGKGKLGEIQSIPHYDEGDLEGFGEEYLYEEYFDEEYQKLKEVSEVRAQSSHKDKIKTYKVESGESRKGHDEEDYGKGRKYEKEGLSRRSYEDSYDKDRPYKKDFGSRSSYDDAYEKIDKKYGTRRWSDYDVSYDQDRSYKKADGTKTKYDDDDDYSKDRKYDKDRYRGRRSFDDDYDRGKTKRGVDDRRRSSDYDDSYDKDRSYRKTDGTKTKYNDDDYDHSKDRKYDKYRYRGRRSFDDDYDRGTTYRGVDDRRRSSDYDDSYDKDRSYRKTDGTKYDDDNDYNTGRKYDKDRYRGQRPYDDEYEKGKTYKIADDRARSGYAEDDDYRKTDGTKYDDEDYNTGRKHDKDRYRGRRPYDDEYEKGKTYKRTDDRARSGHADDDDYRKGQKAERGQTRDRSDRPSPDGGYAERSERRKRYDDKDYRKGQKYDRPRSRGRDHSESSTSYDVEFYKKFDEEYYQKYGDDYGYKAHTIFDYEKSQAELEHIETQTREPRKYDKGRSRYDDRRYEKEEDATKPDYIDDHVQEGTSQQKRDGENYDGEDKGGYAEGGIRRGYEGKGQKYDKEHIRDRERYGDKKEKTYRKKEGELVYEDDEKSKSDSSEILGGEQDSGRLKERRARGKYQGRKRRRSKDLETILSGEEFETEEIFVVAPRSDEYVGGRYYGSSRDSLRSLVTKESFEYLVSRVNSLQERFAIYDVFDRTSWMSQHSFDEPMSILQLSVRLGKVEKDIEETMDILVNTLKKARRIEENATDARLSKRHGVVLPTDSNMAASGQSGFDLSQTKSKFRSARAPLAGLDEVYKADESQKVECEQVRIKIEEDAELGFLTVVDKTWEIEDKNKKLAFESLKLGAKSEKHEHKHDHDHDHHHHDHDHHHHDHDHHHHDHDHHDHGDDREQVTEEQLVAHLNTLENEIWRRFHATMQRHYKTMNFLNDEAKTILANAALKNIKQKKELFLSLNAIVQECTARQTKMDTDSAKLLTQLFDELLNDQYNLETAFDRRDIAMSMLTGNEEEFADINLKMAKALDDIYEFMEQQKDFDKEMRPFCRELKVILSKVLFLREHKVSREEVEKSLKNKIGMLELNGFMQNQYFVASMVVLWDDIRLHILSFERSEMLWQTYLKDIFRSLEEKASKTKVARFRMDCLKKIKSLSERADVFLDVLEPLRRFGDQDVCLQIICPSCDHEQNKPRPENQPHRVPQSVSAGGEVEINICRLHKAQCPRSIQRGGTAVKIPKKSKQEVIQSTLCINEIKVREEEPHPSKIFSQTKRIFKPCIPCNEVTNGEEFLCIAKKEKTLSTQRRGKWNEVAS